LAPFAFVATEKKNERLRTSAESIQKAPTHLIRFPLACLFWAFSGVFQQVEFTKHQLHVENVLQKNEKNSMPFFSVFFN
jgi:hypothetical protein